jgi:hypothetical protein
VKIFYRVFQRDYVRVARFIYCVDYARESCCFSAAGGAGYQHQAVFLVRDFHYFFGNF